MEGGAGHVVVASASAAGDGRVDAMLAAFAVMTSEQVGVSGDGDGHVVEMSAEEEDREHADLALGLQLQ